MFMFQVESSGQIQGRICRIQRSVEYLNFAVKGFNKKLDITSYTLDVNN